MGCLSHLNKNISSSLKWVCDTKTLKSASKSLIEVPVKATAKLLVLLSVSSSSSSSYCSYLEVVGVATLNVVQTAVKL